MHWKSSFAVKAPLKFVYVWMTSPTAADGAYTKGLESREVVETWKFQNTTKDVGRLAGRPYASKAVLRKYPPSRWRVEEEAGAWYHRTEFALEDTPEGTQLNVSMEILVRGARRYFANSFRRKFSKDFGERIQGWVAKIEEEARAASPEELAGAPPPKKAPGPRDIPKQYGS
jgi:hypothetical protein